MRTFKQFFNETVEPVKPDGKVSSKRITKNRGMINQQELLQLSFMTEAGNEVKVQFNEKENGADVVFYVNDTLDDGASGSRDPAILNGVLWLMQVVPGRMKWNVMTFSAWSGSGDSKVIKGLPIDELQSNFEPILNQFINALSKTAVKELEASPTRIELAKKLGRELKPVYDINKEQINSVINQIGIHIKDLSSLLHNDINQLEEFGYTMSRIKSIASYEELIKVGRKLEQAIRSNTEQGFTQVANRRQSLYRKIMDRYFSQIWDIEQRGPNFTLIRKEGL